MLEPTAYVELGRALYFQRKYAEAEAVFREAIRLFPDDASFLAALGDALYAQQKYAEAVARYKAALAIKHDPILKAKLDRAAAAK